MALTNYERGRNKEYRIVEKLKTEGFIAVRSAGSHSEIDIWALHPRNHVIRLIQSKLGHMSKNKKELIKCRGSELNGTYEVRFELWN